jgi:zinc transport system substrate-binding protein
MIPSHRTSCCWLAILLVPIGALCSCRQDTRAASTQSASAPLSVYVSIPPQKHFVERIGGPHVRVSVLLPPGQSPATYEPTPKEVVSLARASVYFRIGVPFEKHLVDKIAAAMKGLNVVDTRKGIELRTGHACCDHSHEHADGHHHHHEQDPHTWMNPRLAKVQADTIHKALCEVDPAHRADYERNWRALAADLDKVDKRIAAALAPLRGKEFFVFHPAFGYFAEAYGLKQVAIETGGKQPSAKQLAALIEGAKKARVRLIFVQPQFDKRNAEVVAKEIGGAVVTLDPLAENYVDNLLHVASQIQVALGATPTKEPGS